MFSMERCLRTALWIVCLIGQLEAKPVCSEGNPGEHLHIYVNDLGFGFLTKDVSCGHNVTFISPTNVQDHCHTAALKFFKEGLEHAKSNCSDDLGRIDQTLEALEWATANHDLTDCPQPIQRDSPECKWDNKESWKQFVKDFESLVELLITASTDN